MSAQGGALSDVRRISWAGKGGNADSQPAEKLAVLCNVNAAVIASSTLHSRTDKSEALVTSFPQQVRIHSTQPRAYQGPLCGSKLLGASSAFVQQYLNRIQLPSVLHNSSTPYQSTPASCLRDTDRLDPKPRRTRRPNPVAGSRNHAEPVLESDF